MTTTITAAQSDAIIALESAGLLTADIAEAILRSDSAATTPTIAPAKAPVQAPARKAQPQSSPRRSVHATPKPKAVKKAPAPARSKAPTMRELSTVAGSMTKAQSVRITAFCDKHDFEYPASNGWSMKTASEFYASLKAAI